MARQCTPSKVSGAFYSETQYGVSARFQLEALREYEWNASKAYVGNYHVNACTRSVFGRTMAREKLSVVIILLANQAYGIFGTELDRLGLNDRSAQRTRLSTPFVLSQLPIC